MSLPQQPATGCVDPGQLLLRVYAVAFEADGIYSFDLRPPDRSVHLPAFTAGAHIDVLLPGGLVRSYSLVNSEAERHRYVIAVSRDAKGRGGSVYMHDRVRPGDVLSIKVPRNTFPLAEDACHSVFLAGGIGVTPIVCMARRMVARGRSWQLHYSARSRASAAFIDELSRLANSAGAWLDFNFDLESGHVLDIPGILAGVDAGSHLYCCGPEPMLEAFEKATQSWPSDRIHLERFGSAPPSGLKGGFRVSLARSGIEVDVPSGSTVLRAVLDAGINVPYSCEVGVCGMCETRVLDGVPDHHDHVLSESERAERNTMMICCSGCVGSRIVLDL